jgi:hypothetical protein
MNSAPVPPRTIWLTLAISILVASLTLVVFILPAEYGVDPLGTGEAMGIARMSGYTVSAVSLEEETFREDYVEFPLGPFESIEYKYALAAGQAMVYSWSAEGEVVFDFHSEERGREPWEAVSFSTGRAAAQHGTYVAPYDGIHGWFWENRGPQQVTVKLQSRGFFSASTTFSSRGEYTREL